MWQDLEQEAFHFTADSTSDTKNYLQCIVTGIWSIPSQFESLQTL